MAAIFGLARGLGTYEVVLYQDNFARSLFTPYHIVGLHAMFIEVGLNVVIIQSVVL